VRKQVMISPATGERVICWQPAGPIHCVIEMVWGQAGRELLGTPSPAAGHAPHPLCLLQQGITKTGHEPTYTRALLKQVISPPATGERVIYSQPTGQIHLIIEMIWWTGLAPCEASLKRTGVHCTCRPVSPCSRRDCVKSLRSSCVGLYPQSNRALRKQVTNSPATGEKLLY